MQFFKKYQKTLIIAVVGIALFLLGGSLVPNFLKPGNLLNVIRQSSVIAIAAVGMSQVIVIKGIDLSVGGNISFCGMVKYNIKNDFKACFVHLFYKILKFIYTGTRSSVKSKSCLWTKKINCTVTPIIS